MLGLQNVNFALFIRKDTLLNFNLLQYFIYCLPVD